MRRQFKKKDGTYDRGGKMNKQQLRQALTEVAFTKFPVFVDPDKEKLEKQQREEAAEASRLKNLAGRVDHETLRKHEIVVGGRGGSLLDRFKESAAMTGKLGAREAAPDSYCFRLPRRMVCRGICTWSTGVRSLPTRREPRPRRLWRGSGS